MSGLEEAVERLKSEGFSSEEIKGALAEMKKEAMAQPRFTGSLDEYLDYLEEE
jgi:hypothetical protein